MPAPPHATPLTSANSSDYNNLVDITTGDPHLAPFGSFISAINVRNRGALGDGTTDDTTAVLDSVNALPAAGGNIFFPPGTYIVANITWPSRVNFIGSGVDVTIIKLKNSSNVDVFKSTSFDSLTGTNSTGGIHSGSIRHMTIDGNKANNLTAGYGVRVYGYGYSMHNVRIRNCRQDGLYSEWSTSTSVPGTGDSMEAVIDDLLVHDNVGNGITWAGPHDSMWTNVITYLNAGKGVYVKQTSAMTGGALVAVNSHSWGLGQTYAWDLEAQAMLMNCQGEGGSTAQLRIGGVSTSLKASGTVVRGGQYFAAGGGTTGIVIGVAAVANPAGYDIDTKVDNCTSGAISYVNDGGIAKVRIHAFQASGAVAVGTPSSDTYQEYHVAGGATGRGITAPSVLPVRLVQNDLQVDSTFGLKTATVTDAIRLKPGGLLGAQIITLASAVNFVSIRGAAAGGSVTIFSDGSDSAVPMLLESKGAAAVVLRPNFVSALECPSVASAVNYLQVIQAATAAAPVVKAVGSDTNIDLGLGITGTGVVDFQYSLVVLGGGAAATLGTIGGSGPATAAQNSWMKVKHLGTLGFIPVWR